MRRLLVTLTAALWLFALPAARAQSSDLLHYDLSLTLRPAERWISASVGVQHVPASRFYLNRAFRVLRIQGNGKDLQFHEDPKAPERAFCPGSRLIVIDGFEGGDLQITYEGRLEAMVFGVNQISPELVELAVYASWYPLFEGAGEFTFDLSAEVPEGNITVTNGERVSERQAGRRTKTNWRSRGQAGDIVLFSSPRVKLESRGEREQRIEVVSENLPRETATSTASGLAWASQRLGEWYGKPSPDMAVRVVFAPRAGWGYSRIPMIVVSEQRALDELRQDHGEAREFRDLAHELAHFWWRIADAGAPDDWINEGFAEYSAYRLAAERFGSEYGSLRLAEYKANAAHNRTSTAIAETTTSSADREINRYDRVALMLGEAEQRFGRRAVLALLRKMYEKHGPTHDATTGNFLDLAGSQIGPEAAEFFRARLYEKPSLSK